jgi:DNA helicase-2/ATP-dependent DNA helicase PcrA
MFQHLNPEQIRAVKSTEGRILILAGAGSGKTSVLAYRMAHMIRDREVSPKAILGLTFTNKAAREMRERLSSIIGGGAKQVTLSTFHSFCMQLLRKEIGRLGYTTRFSLYDEQDVKRVTSQISSDMEKEDETELSSRLNVSMRAYNAVDFDSLLTLTVELLEKHPEVLARLHERYRYIMIDEYQDTNPIQDRLANLLAQKHNNLCVVGDDDQSIYGWRGAEIKQILHFPADVKIKLEENYRSTPVILKAANAVIRNNEERHNKELWTRNDYQAPIPIFHAPTEGEEALAIAQRITWMRAHYGLKWSDFAVLYRSNILNRPLENAFMQAPWEKEGKWMRGIPYQMFGGTELFERSEVKDLVAYMRVIVNPRDQEALLRIINVPRRGIAEGTLDVLTQINRKRGIPLWDVLRDVDTIPDISSRASKAISSLVGAVEEARRRFEGGALQQTLSWFLEEIEFKRSIEEEIKTEAVRVAKWNNIGDCVRAVGYYEENAAQSEEEISLENFISSSLLNNDKFWMKHKEEKEDKVSLMTFHSAKGLEFPVCFLMGLEDHLIPHEKSASEGRLEEERRLMYVAMTRAKKHLILSMSRTRKRAGSDGNSNPSRFLFEIPKELLKVSSWQTVEI